MRAGFVLGIFIPCDYWNGLKKDFTNFVAEGSFIFEISAIIIVRNSKYQVYLQFLDVNLNAHRYL